MKTNIYLQLTEEFNAGRLRTIICSGQAVVLHRVAIMSKDGDWILREDKEACNYVLSVLERHGARYRFGAPLDVHWLSQGWSSHFEFNSGILRVRTDFFTRPPRISETELSALWREQTDKHPPFVNLVQLARLKQTDREKDYVVIGELAQRMNEPADQLQFSRSALDLMRLAKQYPSLTHKLIRKRPLLARISSDRECLEAALDAERRNLIHINEKRLAHFEKSASRWRKRWADMARTILDLPLRQSHSILVKEAKKYLPCSV